MIGAHSRQQRFRLVPFRRRGDGFKEMPHGRRRVRQLVGAPFHPGVNQAMRGALVKLGQRRYRRIRQRIPRQRMPDVKVGQGRIRRPAQRVAIPVGPRHGIRRPGSIRPGGIRQICAWHRHCETSSSRAGRPRCNSDSTSADRARLNPNRIILHNARAAITQLQPLLHTLNRHYATL